MERKSVKKRKTAETDISIELTLSSLETSSIDSGVPFFDHMLASMCRHGRLCLKLKCSGDYEIDDHHSIEDIGICLGSAFSEALGDKKGIVRFGEAVAPMDDALSLASVDLSGRSFYRYSGPELEGDIKEFSEELTNEFLRTFSLKGSFNLHIKVFHGENRHHIHESIYKALGLALYRAYSIDKSIGSRVMSTKGTLE